jgi:hypothetical protein
MKTVLKSWVAQAFALMMAASVAFAQDRAPFPQPALDQMLAPVALYPDPLLAQVLMASTYPLEVVQAARWSRANPGLKGQDAVRAVEPFDWDPSVQSLAAFPQVLAMMDGNLEWMERLGEAFIAQQSQVMDTVQGLRRRAEAAGNLRSSNEMQVAREGEVITLAPPAPQVVYVPYYDPRVVYGSWWWPAHPPVYWAPQPAYYVVPAHRPAFFWGSGIAISAGFFFGHTDWHHRHVTVARHRATVVHGPAAGTRTVWRHNPAHRRGVPLRHAAAQERFEPSRVYAPRASAAPLAPNAPAPAARQLDERRAAARAPRQGQVTERRVEQRQPAAPLAAPNANRPFVNRDDERPRPAGRVENRFQTGGLQQSGERRGAPREAPRPQARAAVVRPAAVAPAARPAVQPVARPPVHRTDTRAAPVARPATGPARAARRENMN